MMAGRVPQGDGESTQAVCMGATCQGFISIRLEPKAVLGKECLESLDPALLLSTTAPLWLPKPWQEGGTWCCFLRDFFVLVDPKLSCGTSITSEHLRSQTRTKQTGSASPALLHFQAAFKKLLLELQL